MARWVLALWLGTIVVFASASATGTCGDCDADELDAIAPVPRDPAWDLLIRPTITTPTKRACAVDIPAPRAGQIASPLVRL